MPDGRITLVPTLRAGMPSWTLRVRVSAPDVACAGRGSHDPALCGSSPCNQHPAGVSRESRAQHRGQTPGRRLATQCGRGASRTAFPRRAWERGSCEKTGGKTPHSLFPIRHPPFPSHFLSGRTLSPGEDTAQGAAGRTRSVCVSRRLPQDTVRVRPVAPRSG